MSLCDKCFAPGACCKGFVLRHHNDELLTLWADRDLVEQLRAYGLPFNPGQLIGEWTDDAGRAYQSWNMTCPRLLPNGRCGDYDNRPAICRGFEAGSGPLCVHWRGAEGGEG